jgi:UDP-glucuronate 4-epimerase
MAHTYSHLYGLPATGLRFFTVYGPWGRPDMALFLFTKAMLALDKPASPDPATSWAPHRVFNIGNSNPIPLITYIEAVENALGITATKTFLPMQPGDGPATAAACR